MRMRRFTLDPAEQSRGGFEEELSNCLAGATHVETYTHRAGERFAGRETLVVFAFYPDYERCRHKRQVGCALSGTGLVGGEELECWCEHYDPGPE